VKQVRWVFILGAVCLDSRRRNSTIPQILRAAALPAALRKRVKWSPDGKRRSLHHGRKDRRTKPSYTMLTGLRETAGLCIGKLGPLGGARSRGKDDRERETTASATRFLPYQWSTDSKNILFDSLARCGLYTVATGTAVQ